MKVNKKVAAAVLGAGALAVGAAGVAVAGGDDDSSDVPITGSALDKATEAALEVTGGGEVTETEVGDEEGAYEVEVTAPDGSQTDVHLDDRFNHIGSEADDENESEGNDSD